MLPNDGRVISNFIVNALQGKPLNIYGNGTQTRSFCYVDDLISGLIKLMDSNINTPINLGNPSEFTIKELALKIKNLINPSLGFIYKELPEDDPLQRKPVIEMANKKLLWEPKIPLEMGLENTIDYFKKINN